MVARLVKPKWGSNTCGTAKLSQKLEVLVPWTVRLYYLIGFNVWMIITVQGLKPWCKVTAAFIWSFLVYPCVKTITFFSHNLDFHSPFCFWVLIIFFKKLILPGLRLYLCAFLYLCTKRPVRLGAKTNTKPVASTTSGPARCENSIHTSALQRGGGLDLMWFGHFSS